MPRDCRPTPPIPSALSSSQDRDIRLIVRKGFRDRNRTVPSISRLELLGGRRFESPGTDRGSYDSNQSEPMEPRPGSRGGGFTVAPCVANLRLAKTEGIEEKDEPPLRRIDRKAIRHMSKQEWVNAVIETTPAIQGRGPGERVFVIDCTTWQAIRQPA